MAQVSGQLCGHTLRTTVAPGSSVIAALIVRSDVPRAPRRLQAVDCGVRNTRSWGGMLLCPGPGSRPLAAIDDASSFTCSHASKSPSAAKNSGQHFCPRERLALIHDGPRRDHSRRNDPQVRSPRRNPSRRQDNAYQRDCQGGVPATLADQRSLTCHQDHRQHQVAARGREVPRGAAPRRPRRGGQPRGQGDWQGLGRRLERRWAARPRTPRSICCFPAAMPFTWTATSPSSQTPGNRPGEWDRRLPQGKSAGEPAATGLRGRFRRFCGRAPLPEGRSAGEHWKAGFHEGKPGFSQRVAPRAQMPQK